VSAQEPLLSGVKVCVASPATIKAECAMTGADGKFTISKLPPNRNAAMSVTVTLSFEKAGYLSQLQAFGLGDGSQNLSNQVRLLTTAWLPRHPGPDAAHRQRARRHRGPRARAGMGQPIARNA
jgi:hypothetical protein